MNKQELITEVHSRVDTGSTAKSTVEQVCNQLFETIQDELAAGNDVNIKGFGVFSVVHKAATRRRNPQTGGTVDVPAKKAPKFKPGKGLKDAVA